MSQNLINYNNIIIIVYLKIAYIIDMIYFLLVLSTGEYKMFNLT